MNSTRYRIGVMCLALACLVMLGRSGAWSGQAPAPAETVHKTLEETKNYFLGRAKPDHIATKATKPGEPALVHSEGHWVSPAEIQFTVVCCGISETIRYRVATR